MCTKHLHQSVLLLPQAAVWHRVNELGPCTQPGPATGPAVRPRLGFRCSVFTYSDSDSWTSAHPSGTATTAAAAQARQAFKSNSNNGAQPNHPSQPNQPSPAQPAQPSQPSPAQPSPAQPSLSPAQPALHCRMFPALVGNSDALGDCGGGFLDYFYPI